MKKTAFTILCSLIAFTSQQAQGSTVRHAKYEQAKEYAGRPVNDEPEWDKTFTKSDKVRHEKVAFRNRFGITLAADLYIP